MPKFIQKHFGKVISIEPMRENEEWAWRKGFVGFVGIIHVYESWRKHKGKKFIVMCDTQLNVLKTGVGDIAYEGDILILTTGNSKYKIQLIGNKENEVK